MFSVEGSLGLVNRNIFCMSICLSDCLFVSLSRADHANNTVAINLMFNAYTNITIASYFHVQAVVPVVPPILPIDTSSHICEHLSSDKHFHNFKHLRGFENCRFRFLRRLF